MTQNREEAVIDLERNVGGLLRRYKISRTTFWNWRRELGLDTGEGRKFFNPPEVQVLDLFYLFTRRLRIPRSEFFNHIYDVDTEDSLVQRFERYLLSQGVNKEQLTNIVGEFYGNHS